ncbi:synergin gamma [Trichonephila clavipes]|nr:synergin gamma [Trichonephila clavipes]
MSNPLRPPIGPQPAMPGRVIAPVCATGAIAYDSCASPMIPIAPNAYGLIAAHPNPYVQHPSFTQQNIPTRVPLISAIPAVPGMFVPVAPINAGLSHSNVDPTKLLEEQKRLEKERNFQLQQQRLKQFTVAGKKGSLNAENLIDSMFGKVQPKQTRSVTNSSTTTAISSELVKPVQPTTAVSQPPPVTRISQTPPVTVAKQEILSSVPSNPQRTQKELEAMMRECSDLSGPQKANKFSKPSVKELAPSAQQRYTFTSSNKSVDWKKLQGLDEVFVTKRPRFPPWCSKEYVPELFKQVEIIVTNNGTTAPDTKLLFPILISSALPQQLLGHIWELVNQSAPGQLTVEEMYAALALIAVTQAGHPVKTVDILHKLPSCPIPQLQCFTNPSQPIPPETQSQPQSVPLAEEKAFPTYADVTPDQNTHLVLRPSAISLKDVSGSAGILNKPENNSETVNNSKNVDSSALGFLSSPDDEFDDFKSATPTAVNFSIHTPSSDSVQATDDFADFKQAPPLSSSMTFKKDPTPVVREKPSLEEQDLMSPEEDKYSVFRSLQQVESADDWGNFSSVTNGFTSNTHVKKSDVEEASQSDKAILSELHSNPTVLVSNSNFFEPNSLTPVNTDKEDDDFGEFLHAEPPVSTVDSVISHLEDLNTNFADFSNFKEADFQQDPPTIGSAHMPHPDDEFSDFASSLPVPCKPELGPEFLFCHLKDNISLAESQSVSSLELGTFDGGGHSGESKSSLSRQGSIPSLDLKSTFIEGVDNEDCFGEFQSPITVDRASKSPSPAKDAKGQESNNSSSNSLSLNFQNARSLPLTDKYSVIRAEESRDEDQHISCWIRCLQSSVNIIQNTKKIFNQMSCSSVCNEILHTEEGENYIKDVIEVYKVVCRIAAASKSASKQTTQIIDLLNESDQAWQTICGFIAGSTLMPKEASLEFSSAVLSSNVEDNRKACGLCLLNIEMKSKFGKEETLNLSYGGRNYHSTCANLWVNCVDPLLPALPLPQLL